MRRRVALVLALVALAGCGDTGTPGAPNLSAPDVRLHLASGPVDLEAWTACYGNGCYDGAPPKDPVDAGRTEAVEFSFAREGWTFEATFRETGAECPRQITVPTVAVSPTRFRVLPTGNPGTWDVDLFGRGPGGDAITTFRWVTTEKGSFPDEVTSSLAVLADHDGRLDSYGVELGVSDLARTPRSASAMVTVIATDGTRATIELGSPPRERCWSAGRVSWTAADSVAQEATELPGKVFEYVVQLTLDGATYTGRGTWPTDTNEEITPAVPLTWAPALPVYRG